MSKENLYIGLEKIKILLDGAPDSGPGEIEKDLILATLRGMYEEIKFGAAAVGQTEVREVHNGTGPAAVSAPLEREAAGMPVAEALREPDEPELPVVEAIAGVEAEPDGDAGIAAETENTVPVKDAETEKGEDISAKPKLARNVILSLYGDEETEASLNRNTPYPEEKSGTQAGPESRSGILENSGGARKAVIGDVPGSGDQTISDAYARNNHSVDMATKISSESVTDLRKAIGLNDRFLIIRDVFSGSSTVYEEVITELNGFDDLDEVLLHIHDAYSWNPNSDGVKLLIDLLTKKLS